MSKYYLKANIENENGKKRVNNFDLYNDKDLVKNYNVEESSKIKKQLKKYGIKIKKSENGYTVTDSKFIEKVIKPTENTVSKKNNKLKKIAILSTLGTMTIIGAINLNKKIVSTDEGFTIESEADYLDDNDIILEANVELSKPKYMANTEVELKKSEEKEEYDDIFEFSYEDRSSSENTVTVTNNYEESIEKYSKTYGIDPKLMKAIICQENPNNWYNDGYIGGHGVTEIENIWDGYPVTAYNFDNNEYEESDPIDISRCDIDQDYSIKLGCMILNNYYNYIHNNYSNKLSSEEELAATVFAYNKGITAVDSSLYNTNNYSEFLYDLKNNSFGGDNDYLEHIFSYINDEELIKMKSADGKEVTIKVDNLSVENKHKTR